MDAGSTTNSSSAGNVTTTIATTINSTLAKTRTVAPARANAAPAQTGEPTAKAALDNNNKQHPQAAPKAGQHHHQARHPNHSHHHHHHSQQPQQQQSHYHSRSLLSPGQLCVKQTESITFPSQQTDSILVSDQSVVGDSGKLTAFRDDSTTNRKVSDLAYPNEYSKSILKRASTSDRVSASVSSSGSPSLTSLGHNSSSKTVTFNQTVIVFCEEIEVPNSPSLDLDTFDALDYEVPSDYRDSGPPLLSNGPSACRKLPSDHDYCDEQNQQDEEAQEMGCPAKKGSLHHNVTKAPSFSSETNESHMNQLLENGFIKLDSNDDLSDDCDGQGDEADLYKSSYNVNSNSSFICNDAMSDCDSDTESSSNFADRVPAKFQQQHQLQKQHQQQPRALDRLETSSILANKSSIISSERQKAKILTSGNHLQQPQQINNNWRDDISSKDARTSREGGGSIGTGSTRLDCGSRSMKSMPARVKVSTVDDGTSSSKRTSLSQRKQGNLQSPAVPATSKADSDLLANPPSRDQLEQKHQHQTQSNNHQLPLPLSQNQQSLAQANPEATNYSQDQSVASQESRDAQQYIAFGSCQRDRAIAPAGPTIDKADRCASLPRPSANQIGASNNNPNSNAPIAVALPQSQSSCQICRALNSAQNQNVATQPAAADSTTLVPETQSRVTVRTGPPPLTSGSDSSRNRAIDNYPQPVAKVSPQSHGQIKAQAQQLHGAYSLANHNYTNCCGEPNTQRAEPCLSGSTLIDSKVPLTYKIVYSVNQNGDRVKALSLVRPCSMPGTGQCGPVAPPGAQLISATNQQLQQQRILLTQQPGFSNPSSINQQQFRALVANNSSSASSQQQPISQLAQQQLQLQPTRGRNFNHDNQQQVPLQTQLVYLARNNEQLKVIDPNSQVVSLSAANMPKNTILVRNNNILGTLRLVQAGDNQGAPVAASASNRSPQTVYYLGQQPLNGQHGNNQSSINLLGSTKTTTFPDPHEVRRLDGLRSPAARAMLSSNSRDQLAMRLDAQTMIAITNKNNHNQHNNPVLPNQEPSSVIASQSMNEMAVARHQDDFEDPTFGFSNRPSVKVVTSATSGST